MARGMPWQARERKPVRTNRRATHRETSSPWASAGNCTFIGAGRNARSASSSQRTTATSSQSRHRISRPSLSVTRAARSHPSCTRSRPAKSIGKLLRTAWTWTQPPVADSTRCCCKHRPHRHNPRVVSASANTPRSARAAAQGRQHVTAAHDDAAPLRDLRRRAALSTANTATKWGSACGSPAPPPLVLQRRNTPPQRATKLW